MAPGGRRAAFARGARIALAAVAAGAVALAAATALSYQAPPERLAPDGPALKFQVLDRRGEPLHHTYRNRWNASETLPLHAVPELLRTAFVVSEDRRFFERAGGPDWRARGAALWQNLRAGRVVRGASTITEQVVRLWHPRPRTPWARWMEGVEAGAFVRRFERAALLEFYLNQVPYAANRRGVVQAARYWFGRDLDTLSRREMLALVVLARAPGRLDPRRERAPLERGVHELATRLVAQGALPAAELAPLLAEPIALADAPDPVEASHFVERVARSVDGAQGATIVTTLDAGLQRQVQQLLDARLKALGARAVANGAVLVYDHQDEAVRAWVVGGAGDPDAPGTAFDAVDTPRQPGSTLKPFVYALALERGWTAATLIDDSPLTEAVAGGVHAFRNYSRTYHGPIPLRDALGNSLNVPAVRAARFVGPDAVLERLRQLGFASLSREAGHYGDGVALGAGAVKLAELVQGYAALARGGVARPLRLTRDAPVDGGQRAFSPEVASLIGDILSDPRARRLEFGAAPLLRLPVQTAVKTGTSNDHHDAWAVGYDHRHVVGIWMGNLDGAKTEEVTGSSGPSVVLRAVFAELNRGVETRPLWLSPRLTTRAVCVATGLAADGRCAARDEHFVPGTEPAAVAAAPARAGPPRFETPHDGLRLALDPRVPDALESYRFALAEAGDAVRVEWWVDGALAATTTTPWWDWPVTGGAHRVRARVWRAGEDAPLDTAEVGFSVR